MTNIYKSTILITAAFIATGCASNPKVIGQKIDRKVFCPSAGKYCTQNIGNKPAISLTKEPRYLSTASNGEPNYWDYLGREYTKSGDGIVNYCGNEATNALLTYAEANGESRIFDTAVSNSVDFTRKVENKNSFSTGVDVDAIVNAAGIPTETTRAEAEAAVKAALTKIDNSDIMLKGQYSYIHLNQGILSLLKAETVPAELQACANALKKKNTKPIIVAITMAKIDTLTKSGTISKSGSASLESALNSKLTEDELVGLKTSFENSVNDKYTVEFKPTYQLLSIGGWKPKN